MDEFISIKLTKSFLEQSDLPDILYPIPTSRFEEFVKGSGNLGFHDLLYFLQEYSCTVSEWAGIEEAMMKLTTILAPHEDHTHINAQGDEWFIVCGAVDLGKEIVTIQRVGHLVAAIRPMPDGRLVFSAYRPLDAKSADYLLGLSIIPGHDNRVCMRDNNWEYALDCSAGMGNMYASERGEAYLSYWQYGLGLCKDGTTVESWYKQRTLEPIKPKYTAMQLGVYYESKPKEE
jgi:hypothetical protein